MLEKPFAAYRGDEPYVFVSYAHKDAELVYPLIQGLHESGLRIWYDEGIRVGSQWAADLAQAIKSCERFLFFASPRSVASEVCLNEIHYALSNRLAPVVVHLEPTHLSDELSLLLNRHQAIKTHEIRSSDRITALFDALSNKPVAPVERTPLAAAAQEPAVAVIPFRNIGSDAEDEYLSDGIAEELLTGLAQVSGLRVAASSACFKFKGDHADPQVVARELMVNTIVEGSLRRAGPRIRVNVSVIDALSGFQRWSNRYDGTLDDVFDLQDKIAADIVAELRSQFRELGEEPRISGTRNLEAYRSYLRGAAAHRRFDPAAIIEAIMHYRSAVKEDPSYFEAHLALAEAVKDTFTRDDDKTLNLADEAIEQASALAHTARQKFQVQRVSDVLDLKRGSFNILKLEANARDRLLANIEQDESRQQELVGYSIILVATGLYYAARAYLQSVDDAGAVDQGWFWSGCAAAGCGDFDNAIRWFDLAIENDARLSVSAWLRTLTKNAAGRVGESWADIERLAEVPGIDPLIIPSCEAMCLYSEGRLDELTELMEQTRFGRLTRSFCLFAVGDWERGMDCLEKIPEKASIQLSFMLLVARLMPDVEARLANMERYQNFLERIGFDEKHGLRILEHVRAMEPVTGITI